MRVNDNGNSVVNLTKFSTKSIKTSGYTSNDVPSINYTNENYVKTTGNSIIDGNLSISGKVIGNLCVSGEVIGDRAGVYFYGDTGNNEPYTTLHNYLNNTLGKKTGIVFGMCKYDMYVLFQTNISDRACVFDINKFASSGIKVKYYDDNGADNFSGSWYPLSQSNTTITNYSPIEQSMSSINDFIIGGPIYMSGKVYKQTNEGWQPSTIDDTTDCICSVKLKGKWNEYVGSCVEIDEDNYCLTFATHGDYLVKVSDTSLYSVGDEIFIDDDNVLKILSGNTAITSKIQRTIIGIITSKINEKFMAVFKS